MILNLELILAFPIYSQFLLVGFLHSLEKDECKICEIYNCFGDSHVCKVNKGW